MIMACWTACRLQRTERIGRIAAIHPSDDRSRGQDRGHFVGDLVVLTVIRDSEPFVRCDEFDDRDRRGLAVVGIKGAAAASEPLGDLPIVFTQRLTCVPCGPR